MNEAIVKISKSGGRGVLVGEIVLTAAHCVEYSFEGEMVLSEYFVEDIKTPSGERLKVRPLAIEPVADVAVLGALDDQEFSTEAKAFDDFCARTNPIPLARSCPTLRQPFPIKIFNANGEWVNGTGELAEEFAPYIFTEAGTEIRDGASGGPILNQEGELIGIVSHFSEGESSLGRNPFLLKALPRWILEKYFGF
jgi:S1-C subfamily serine protease